MNNHLYPQSEIFGKVFQFFTSPCWFAELHSPTQLVPPKIILNMRKNLKKVPKLGRNFKKISGNFETSWKTNSKVKFGKFERYFWKMLEEIFKNVGEIKKKIWKSLRLFNDTKMKNFWWSYIVPLVDLHPSRRDVKVGESWKIDPWEYQVSDGVEISRSTIVIHFYPSIRKCINMILYAGFGWRNLTTGESNINQSECLNVTFNV